jgi:hypothetical protein
MVFQSAIWSFHGLNPTDLTLLSSALPFKCGSQQKGFLFVIVSLVSS